MLLCSSRIPVSGELTADAFVTLAIEWVTNSRNYSFDPFGWDGSPDYTCVGKKQEIFQVGLFDEGAVCAVHFKAVDNREISWTTDFILDCANHILAFQLYRDAPEDVDYVHPVFSLPVLVRKIISAGYAASDKGLEVTDKPILARDEDADDMARIILRETVYNMPVVYMSCESDGHCVVNPYMVAEKLNGVAHVVFETTRSLSFSLRDKTDGRNPYAGAIEIFYSNGNRKFLPVQVSGTHSQKVYTIVNTVFEHLNQLRVEDRFSWSQLQSDKLRKQLSAAIQKKRAGFKRISTA